MGVTSSLNRQKQRRRQRPTCDLQAAPVWDEIARVARDKIDKKVTVSFCDLGFSKTKRGNDQSTPVQEDKGLFWITQDNRDKNGEIRNCVR